ncbi:oligopeptidase A [Salmonella enterica subsp. enterica]|uniref:Oligopeptidase A n=1 Tax=Salmonella enterica I TaxID=59201 RepID=A0A379W0G9_SALET|nr:oligopeptidase A [Salmonella enterica subsp. enterica]
MRKADGTLQKPVAYLTCNFNRPVNGKPALFTHDEVITLFHEFGHGLHHMLTRIETAGVSGISGVPWDAVELPSQFMENWCWEPEALAFISGHYETGEPLPKELLDKMLAAKNYQAALFILRQLEFGLFDSVCMRNLIRSKERKFLRRSLKSKNRSPWCRHRHGAASHMRSAISLLAAMRQATTAICGPTYWRRTLIPALRRKAFSTVRPVSRSLITS